MNRRRNRSAVLGAVVVAGFLMAAASAFACVNIATLVLSSDSGPAGARVTVTGAGYAAEPVVLRWNSATGDVLVQVVPNAKGEITTEFTVPLGTSGYYSVVGVERDKNGADRYGTPSRATYQILDAAVAPPRATTAAAVRHADDALPVAPVAVSLVLLAGVAVAVPVAARVRSR